MAEKIVKPERRRVDRRQDRLAALGDAVEEGGWGDRRVHCWDLEVECTEERRKRCAAHFVKRNCWDLWAVEYFPPGRKPCCHGDVDCTECPIASAKFGATLAVHVPIPARGGGVQGTATPADRSPTYCAFLYSLKESSGARGDDTSRTVFRCQRRPGIQLHSTYVSEVCGSPEHRECTFYDTK